mgnify:CR=1 FL=1
MRWTSLLVAVIFAAFTYSHLTSGTAFFGFYYAAVAGIAFLGFMKRTMFFPTVAVITVGIGVLIMLFPSVSLNDGMFYTEEGREFMIVILAEVWMLSLVIEHVRLHGSPFASEDEEPHEEEEADGGDENEMRDSEQP